MVHLPDHPERSGRERTGREQTNRGRTGREGTDRGSGDRVLIAGVGNVFCTDDGFGVAVIHRLARDPLPAPVDLRDYGIRGRHLAAQHLDDYGLVVLVDALHRDGPPGTLYVVEAADDAAGAGPYPQPDGVLALVPALHRQVARVVVVGCEPGDIGTGIGLSPAVDNAVRPAAKLVLDIVTRARRSWSG
ncbi:hydrogenase maturation protease [Actinopolymorpha singaporensis]|uniref:Hydrogenase maturation protease n=1 Tax=Actinopolymorpha singaporensis TaxID=117157 RepID=A0A1H1UH02_9ACTN|nr:hydrogenase maturation protease [Actinopolymorpha singaporensis]